ncbi:MAG TPA: hypothetical protein VH280_16055 [Verrucomicrobiae bacterium]|jgi:hypothetical protein|nr:hypothetical protein [Verrucomicrobiae bacterium]
MHRFSTLAVVVAIGFAFGTGLAQATDTPAQAAARAALQQQMNQAEQPPGSTNSMTPPATPSAPPATSTPPPAQPPSVPMPTPQFSTNIPVTPEEQAEMAPAKMSQTNESANAEMNTRTHLPALTVPPPSQLMTNAEQYPVNPPMTPLPPAPGDASMPPPSAPMESQPMPSSTIAQPGPATPELPPALVNGQQPLVAPAPATTHGASLNQEPATKNSAPNYDTSLRAPPLPISQQQQAELQSLLSRYMANQITPAEYQRQRAQIIGQQ